MKLWLQYLLPHHLLTAIAGALTHWRFGPWKRFLIKAFCRAYRPNMDEALHTDRDAYEHFNDFFTRPLNPDARPLPADDSLIVSPVDGVLSQSGRLNGERIIQAKGHSYDAAELLDHATLATRFTDGSFLTLYLSPSHYHRVHMPVDGALSTTRFVPGRLFSVAPFTVQGVPDLFCRNERLVCVFDTSAGLMAQVLVGAMLVAGIESVWHGRYGHPAQPGLRQFEKNEIRLQRGDEMGRFNYGSTVILLFPPSGVQLRDELTAGHELRVGEPIARIL